MSRSKSEKKLRAGVATRTATSVAEFIDTAMAFAAEWGNADGFVFRPWFRGHGDASWPLVPAMYRSASNRLPESECCRDFKKRAYPYLTGTGREPADDWEWYFIMQHHGLPTRLLDWSESALVGLYFAVREPHDGRDAAVWMLDPWWLNETIAAIDNCVLDPSDVRAEPYLALSSRRSNAITAPIAVNPPHATRRLAAQKGVFTLHGTQREPIESYPPTKTGSARLVKIVIPSRDVRNTKIQLAIAGVSETTVFPELPSLCRELQEYWSGEW